MEAIFLGISTFGFIIVVSIDAAKKRRTFLNKGKE